MPTILRFESTAQYDYDNAIRHYATEADDERVASRFVTAIEAAVEAICAAPMIWRVVERPDIRRFVLRRFPFVI